MIKKLTIVLTLSLLPPLAGAQGSAPGAYSLAPRGAVNWYFRSGGQRPMTAASFGRRQIVKIGGSGKLGLGYSCGQFDPQAAIENLLKGVANSADAAMNAAVAQAQAIVMAAPMIILQRADPALYEFIQSVLARAELALQFTTRSCEQLENAAANGHNPLAGLPLLAKAYDLGGEALDNSDLISAWRSLSQKVGQAGLPWLNGNAGGSSQAPLKFVSDVVKAGYNALFARPLTESAPLSGEAAASPVGQVWSDPAALEAWAVEVLGDVEARTCQGCEPVTTPGRGVHAWLAEEAEGLRYQFNRMAYGVDDLSVENLQAASAPNVGVNHSVLTNLQTVMLANEAEGLALANNLAWKVATARAVSRLVLLRRLLLSGKDVPEVRAVQVAQDVVDERIERIDQELQQIQLESQLQAELVGEAALAVGAAAEQLSEGLPQGRPRSETVYQTE